MGWFALAAAALTVGLVAYGAWVRVSASGLGCPNWPLCDEDFFPAGKAALIESGHRWYAGLVLIMSLIAAVWGFFRRNELPAASRALMASALIIVIQAVLGGIVVLTDLHPFVRLVHLALAMATIAFLTVGGVHLLIPRIADGGGRRGWHLLLAGAGVIMVGGSIVATRTTFDCAGLPLCSSESAMAAWVHGAHRVLGVLVFLAAGGLALRRWRQDRDGASYWVPAGVALAVAGQVIVGVSAIALDVPGELRILHVGLAALIWWGLVAAWMLPGRQSAA